MKNTIKNRIVRFLFTIIILDLLCLACISRNQKTVRKNFFLKENKDVNFSNWQGWMITYGNGKYVVVFKSDATKEKKRLFFFQRNSEIITKLILDDKISGGINIDTLSNNILWKKEYMAINFEDLKSHIDFVINYNIELVDNYANPNRIIFESFHNEFELCYLFNVGDSILLRNEYRYINNNWFEYKNISHQ